CRSVVRVGRHAFPTRRSSDLKYGGERFPEPDAALTRRTYVSLPSVIGMSVDDAERTLENAGFSVTVGDAVDGTEAAGTIIEQDRSEEHTSELQSRENLVCRLL